MRRFSPSCLLLLLLLLAACKSSKKEAQSMPILTVQTTVAGLDTLPVEREFIGTLQANYSAVIQPRVNAWLVKKHYQNGASVKRGAPLFTLDASPFSTSRLAAQAQLESARAQLLEARNNYERAVPLARIEAISQTQLDQYRAQYSAAEAAVKSAEQSLRSAQLEEGYTRILSPIDGIVASSEAHAGDYVGPGTKFQVLTTISNLDTLSVDLALPMREYLALGGGDSEENSDFVREMHLYLSDGSLYPYSGRYSYTHKDVSSSEGTLLFSVDFPNPDRLLREGQFARVKASLGAGLPQVVLPQRAVMQTQGICSVWVVEPDSTVRYREVQVGDTRGEAWCIESGLEPGERVLITGLQKVHNGMKIHYK